MVSKGHGWQTGKVLISDLRVSMGLSTNTFQLLPLDYALVAISPTLKTQSQNIWHIRKANLRQALKIT